MKSKLWLILWIISMGIGNTISFIHHLNYSLENGTPPPVDPLSSAPTSSSAHLQLFLFLLYVPFITLPLSVRMVYCATKENKKTIRIFGIFVIVIQIAAIISTLIRWISTGDGFA